MYQVQISNDQNKVTINGKVSVFIHKETDEQDEKLVCEYCCFYVFDDYCKDIPCMKRLDKKRGYFKLEKK